MQGTYALQMTPAIAGMPLLAPRVSRPRQLARQAQVLSLTITAGAGTDPVALTITDLQSGQAWALPSVTGSANEATLGAAIRAAVAANPKWNSLVTVAATTEVDGSNLVLAFTARHANRSYSITRVGGPDGAAATSTSTVTTAAGGAGLAFGQLVARGTADDEFAAMTSTTTVEQIAGMLFRSDANHFHALPSDFGDELTTDSDLCLRGHHYPIAEDGEFWITVTEAVTPASRVYVRVEGSSIGDWGDTPAGTAQTLTVTPVVNRAIYGFSFGVVSNGRRYQIEAVYHPTDATTSIADACAGLFDAVTADIAANGLAAVLVPTDNTTTLTIAASAGVLVDEPSVHIWSDDTEAATATATVSAADVDMLDVSSICRYTSTAAAGALAKVKLQMQP
jgi:hypothetical protein